jgi:peptide deformylase
MTDRDAVREIWVYHSGAKQLSGKQCEPIVKFDDNLHQLVDEMWRSMYFYKGVGLSASQIGIFVQVAVIDMKAMGVTHEPMVIVNPKVELSGEKILYKEGCLSLPGRGMSALVPRSKNVRLEYFDREGNPQVKEASGLLARAILHEWDHLQGVFFIDHLGAFHRKMFVRKMDKNLAVWRRNTRQNEARKLAELRKAK